MFIRFLFASSCLDILFGQELWNDRFGFKSFGASDHHLEEFGGGDVRKIPLDGSSCMASIRSPKSSIRFSLVIRYLSINSSSLIVFAAAISSWSSFCQFEAVYEQSQAPVGLGQGHAGGPQFYETFLCPWRFCH
jgi:hypothetical protein